MKITVVIPCRNEVQYIEECIDAILNSNLELGVEIKAVVVDGMSDDGTRDLVEGLTNRYPNLFMVDNVNQIAPFAFNLGIYFDQSVDNIQIVGARQILSPNYIQDALNVLKKDDSIWCVGGRVENSYVNEIGKIISIAMASSFGMGLGNFRTLEKSDFTDTVGTPMYPYWVFEKIGYFDEELIRNQDDDFNFRITKAGGKIYYCHDISLKYYVRGNYEGLWRQFFQYGYWKVFVNKKHKAVTTLRQLVPPMFVLYLLICALSVFTGSLLFFICSLPLFGYLLLSIYFTMILSDEKTNKWDVFKTFPILHVSYGLGYLKGIVDFLILNKKPSNKQKRLSR